MKKIFTLLAMFTSTLAAFAFPPAQLTVTTLPGHFHLSWSDTAQGETGWEAQVYFTRNKTHTWIPWNNLDPLPTDCTAVDVEYGLRGYYSFRVRPVGEGSPWSNVVTVYVK